MKRYIIIPLVILLILCIPIRAALKDGGSVVYKAVLYEIRKGHAFCVHSPEECEGYMTGIAVKVFGKEIYNNIKCDRCGITEQD